MSIHVAGTLCPCKLVARINLRMLSLLFLDKIVKISEYDHLNQQQSSG